MRRFKLLRYKDISGVSGTGIVAEGCQFSNGQCVLVWLGEKNSINIYNSADDIESIHDHQETEDAGGTRIVWVDKE